ncbi:hypothetical protein CIB48_g10154 [Xylaria polymorpha]|nr:hypothetical protein CIB48_g10154 [Xylaria polymorpha]
MSPTQGLAIPDAPYTYCYCENKAPYLFIAPLDNEGHPDWTSAHTGRAAICWKLKCDFLESWPGNETGPSAREGAGEWEDQYREYRSRQQGVSGNTQKSVYDRVKVLGADNAIGGKRSLLGT